MAVLRKLTEHFIATRVDDEILIVDLDGGELFSLLGTAQAIWDAIDGRRDAAAIADLMAERFTGDRDTIAVEAAELLHALEKAKLVESAPIC